MTLAKAARCLRIYIGDAWLNCLKVGVKGNCKK